MTKFELTEEMREALSHISSEQVRRLFEKTLEMAWSLGINEGLRQAAEIVGQKADEVEARNV